MDFKLEIKKILKDALKEIAPNHKIESVTDIPIEIPEDQEHGSFSSTIGLSKFKEIKSSAQSDNVPVSPFDLSTKIKEQIEINKPSFIKKIQVLKPGFINFFLDERLVYSQIIRNALDRQFLPINTAAISRNANVKVIVEHTSVNPNKAMHIGHLRNAILGDTLARLYKKFGYKVEVQNYIDDTGLQVADTTAAILYLNKKQLESQSFEDYCWDVYAEINRKYEEKDPDLLEKREEVTRALEEGNNETSKLSQEIVSKIVKSHIALMGEFSIFYDLLIYESHVIEFGFWKTAFELLKKSPNFYLETEGKQEGCWVLKYENEKFGNKIFVRKNGTVLYTAKDTAYALWDFGLLDKDFKYSQTDFKNLYATDESGENMPGVFGKGNLVTRLVDERQSYPMEMVRYALKSIGYEDAYEGFRHLAYGVVNLSENTAKDLGLKISENKSSYAMSGRKGIGVKATSLLNLMKGHIEATVRESSESLHKSSDLQDVTKDVAIGAIKYYMLKYNPASEIIFDYKLASQTRGNTGPYLQYSFARASKILQNLKKQSYDDIEIPEVLTDSEKALLETMSKWPEVLTKSKETLALSYIADYSFELASAFHVFYEFNNVLKAKEQVKNFRLLIVQSFINTLEDVLNLLGIKPVAQM